MIKSSERRARRAKKIRYKCKESGANLPRLSVYKTLQHIYAQLFVSDGSKVLASASSLDKEIRAEIKEKFHKKKANVEVAKIVGRSVALRVLNNTDITRVVFDRSGYKYHGVVKALAEAARENGLVF